MANLTPNVCDGFGNAINLDENGVAITAAPGKNINLGTSGSGAVELNGTPIGSDFVALNPTASQTVNLETFPLSFTMSLADNSLTIGDDSNTGILTIHTPHSQGISLFSYNHHTGTLNFSESGGTQAIPTATSLNDNLAAFYFSGYSGSGYVLSASISLVATENWTGTAKGSQIKILTTVTGTNTTVQSLLINNDGTGSVLALKFGIATTQSPTSGGTAGFTGQITWDAGFIYVCTAGGAAGSATWKKAALVAA